MNNTTGDNIKAGVGMWNFGEGVENVQGYKYTSLLYKNLLVDSLSTTYNWLKLDLEGSKHSITNNGWSNQSNHSAIGARVILHLSDKINVQENKYYNWDYDFLVYVPFFRKKQR